GLSHNAVGNSSRRNGTIVIEEIEQVLSVDLVADAATNASLHESRRPHATLADLRSLRILYGQRLRGLDEALAAGVYSKVLRESICAAMGEAEIKRLLEAAKRHGPRQDPRGAHLHERKIRVPESVRDGRSLADWAQR